jgi:hypothetical protein
MMLWIPSVLALMGCSKKVDDVQFVPGEIPGTGTVTFSTHKEGDAWVQFGEPESELTGRTASFPASNGSIPVRGLPSGKEVELEVVVDDGGKELHSKSIVQTIAPPDSQVPPLAINVWEPELACDPGGHVLFGFLGADTSGIAIIDRDGNYVWSYGSPDPQQQIARVRPGRDGQSLLWNYADVDKVEDIAHIVRTSFDGSERTETRTLSGHHDFVELPDGKLGFLSYEFRTMWAPPEDEGEVVTVPAELGCIFGEHPWWSAGEDLSVKDSDKASIELVLNFQDTTGDGVPDVRDYNMLVRGNEDVVTSGSFELDTTEVPWTITLTQAEPEAATFQGLIEVHHSMLKLEVVQTEPDLGLSPPTREGGLGSSSGGGLSPGDNVLTFRREVSVAADAIYEVAEGATETGGEYIVWSAFEDYPQGIYRLPEEGFQCSFLPEAFEFGHANSLGYVESTTSYFMMWRWLDTLLQIERDGSLTWQWGGPFSDLGGNEDDLFYHAHFSDVWDGGMLMFDNRTREENSRLVEYSFDSTSFSQAWELPSDKFETILGDVQRIPLEGCDNLLVSYSGQGRIAEITRDGTTVWEVGASAIGAVIGRVYFLPDLYDMSGVAYPD